MAPSRSDSREKSKDRGVTSPRRDNFLMRTGAIWLPVLFAPDIRICARTAAGGHRDMSTDRQRVDVRPRRQVRVDSVLAN